MKRTLKGVFLGVCLCLSGVLVGAEKMKVGLTIQTKRLSRRQQQESKQEAKLSQEAKLKQWEALMQEILHSRPNDIHVLELMVATAKQQVVPPNPLVKQPTAASNSSGWCGSCSGSRYLLRDKGGDSPRDDFDGIGEPGAPLGENSYPAAKEE